MEEVLGIVGFGLGASLGMSIVRTAGGGLRPLLRGVMKAGIAVGDAVADLTAEARASVDEARAEAAAQRDAAAPQRIVIAHE